MQTWGSPVQRYRAMRFINKTSYEKKKIVFFYYYKICWFFFFISFPIRNDILFDLISAFDFFCLTANQWQIITLQGPVGTDHRWPFCTYAARQQPYPLNRKHWIIQKIHSQKKKKKGYRKQFFIIWRLEFSIVIYARLFEVVTDFLRIISYYCNDIIVVRSFRLLHYTIKQISEHYEK